MRRLQPGAVLTVRAIGGLHVVTLAWDFVEGKEAKREGLLGFAVERSELKGGTVMSAISCAGSNDSRSRTKAWRLVHQCRLGAPDPVVPVGKDYTVKPATTYRYKVVPVYGKPKLIELDEASSTTSRSRPSPRRVERETTVYHPMTFTSTRGGGLSGVRTEVRGYQTGRD